VKRPLVWCAVAVWSALFVARAIGNEPTDGDLWWQRVLGESILRTHMIPHVLGPSTYTAPGAPWVAQEWVFSVAYAWCSAHAVPLLFQLAVAACAVATVVLIAVRADALGGARFAGLAAVIGGAALIDSFGVRDQVVAWPLFAVFLLLFERRDRTRFLAIPVVIVWANLHASVMLAPFIGAIALVDLRRSLGERVAFFAGCALATLCTPFGIALPEMALRWSLDPDANDITEWARPQFADWPFIVGGVLPAIALLADVRARVLDWTRRAIAFFAFAAMVAHARNIATGAIVIIPYAAAVIAAFARPLAARRWTRSDTGLVAIAAAGAVIVAIRAAHAPVPWYPASAEIAATRQIAGPQRVYCEDFSWCSLFAGDDAVRVFLDGRTDAYPHSVFAAWAHVRDAVPGWDDDLAASGTTTIVAWSHGALAGAASQSPHWRPYTADRWVTVFVRSQARP